MSDPKRTEREILRRFIEGDSLWLMTVTYKKKWPEVEAIIRRALLEKPREVSSLYIESEERDMANEKKAKRRKP
jgi:hypothetical protein